MAINDKKKFSLTVRCYYYVISFFEHSYILFAVLICVHIKILSNLA